MMMILGPLRFWWMCFLVVVSEVATQQDAASAVSSDQLSPVDEECCACGHATYTVQFQGLWSRNTHPKGFPDEKNAFQLHWSNIVGATHGTDYVIWDYGQYSSRAVKEVCEFGSSRSLENDMKENSGKIRTVIKTKQLWGPEAILESVKAVYTASKKMHMLSLITMVGPSPDWCLGISRQSMCTKNCTWKDKLEFDLYPWDAGTDSRVTYLGRKTPTVPPERIHRLTSTNPNNLESPFFGVDIKPFARLTITKNKETCADDDGKSNSSEESPSTEELVTMMKKNMMMQKKLEMEKCAMSLWSDWSECSNPCGNGVKERRRMLKNPSITPDMCEQALLESETCVGDCKDTRRKKLHDNFVMRHDEQRDPKDVCAVTAWSEWSPCSASCGLGMKERWRMFLYSSDKQMMCGVHLVEKDLCRGEIPDCQKAMMMKNFTAICRLPADVGPCRGNFTRWFYNHSIQKCQTFSYRGCRGNENRFESEEECVDLCAEHMADMLRKEQMLLKQDMSKQIEMEQQKAMDMLKQLEMEQQKRMEMAKQTEMEKQKQMDMEKQKQMDMEKQKQMEMEKQKEMDMEKQMEMEKQNMLDEEMKRKEMMMHKQRMMEKNSGPDDDDVDEELKSLMMKKQMSHNQDTDQTMIKPVPDQDRERDDKLTRRQQNMLNKKKNRKKLRQKRLHVENDYDDDGDEDENGNWQKGDGPIVDCMMSPWSDWSECSVTCGTGTIMKTRMIKVEPQNGGRKCRGKLIKKKKCRQKKCPVDCEMDEWSVWSPCSESCGSNAVQIRKRRRLQRPLHGGLACPDNIEKKFCNVPMCTGPHVRKNVTSVA